MIVKSAVLPGITVVLYSSTNQSYQVYRTRQMDQPDEDNSYEDINCNHVNIYLIPSTYKRPS